MSKFYTHNRSTDLINKLINFIQNDNIKKIFGMSSTYIALDLKSNIYHLREYWKSHDYMSVKMYHIEKLNHKISIEIFLVVNSLTFRTLWEEYLSSFETYRNICFEEKMI